ncbi:hypothetical protein OSTOST_00878 [Ostertagia ostertagi]
MSLIRFSYIIFPMHRSGKSFSEIHRELLALDSTITYHQVRIFLQKHCTRRLPSVKAGYRARKFCFVLRTIKSIIEDSFSADSSTTTAHIIRRLHERNISISAAQVRRLRKKLGLLRTTTKYCHMIRDVNKEKRFTFCTRMIETNEDFSQCIFTDESTIQRYGVLVQDNAPAHKSAYTTARLGMWKSKLLDWPPESPDLNPIELVWGNMKSFVRKRNVRTVEELRNAVLVFWKTLTPAVCAKYILGIRKRLHRVVEQGGKNIYEGR